MGRVEGRDRGIPDFDSEERQRIQRANQILLRLRKELHDRGARFDEKDVEEASQSARWLKEIIERYPDDWEQAYESALAGSDLPKEDEEYLRAGIDKAGGFVPFTRDNLRKLEEAAPGEGETGDSSAQITRRDLMCGVTAGLLAGGTMMGNSFYFGFAVGVSRNNDCW